ncbi:MAG TPA: S24 family peptidase [Patescibacteria group bacterium]|nr:S24 family peptidase [Patescibacteria group bacterium]
MRLNLSDEAITAELLAEGLRRTGTARITVNGSSMHPTLQTGWGVHLEPSDGTDLRPGDIAVFRTEHNLTVHRLVWIESGPVGPVLVFRGDYNRLRERVPPQAVVARVVAVELPGRKRGMGKIVALDWDALTLFYRGCWLAYRALRPILPKPAPDAAPGWLGRALRAVFAFAERALSFLLPQRR